MASLVELLASGRKAKLVVVNFPHNPVRSVEDVGSQQAGRGGGTCRSILFPSRTQGACFPCAFLTGHAWQLTGSCPRETCLSPAPARQHASLNHTHPSLSPLLLTIFWRSQTGQLPSRSCWEELANACKEHGCYLFSDEMYRGLGELTCAAELS